MAPNPSGRTHALGLDMPVGNETCPPPSRLRMQKKERMEGRMKSTRTIGEKMRFSSQHKMSTAASGVWDVRDTGTY